MKMMVVRQSDLLVRRFSIAAVDLRLMQVVSFWVDFAEKTEQSLFRPVVSPLSPADLVPISNKQMNIKKKKER